jgi:hypothetical protein
MRSTSMYSYIHSFLGAVRVFQYVIRRVRKLIETFSFLSLRVHKNHHLPDPGETIHLLPVDKMKNKNSKSKLIFENCNLRLYKEQKRRKKAHFNEIKTALARKWKFSSRRCQPCTMTQSIHTKEQHIPRDRTSHPKISPSL